jgi:hypothetical protein
MGVVVRLLIISQDGSHLFDLLVFIRLSVAFNFAEKGKGKVHVYN